MHTEDYILGGSMLKGGVSNYINARYIDDNWSKSFVLQKHISSEIFSEIYLIKML
jgi:hypothetical protein